MSGLPPPPPEPSPGGGYGGAPPPVTPYGMPLPESPPTSPVPRWRTAGVGWIVLHLAIGIAIWFGLLFVAMLVAILAGRTYTSTMDTDQTVGTWSLLVFLGGVVGWMLFVYLRTSAPVRWLVFAAVAGLPTLGLIVVLFDRLPSA